MFKKAEKILTEDELNALSVHNSQKFDEIKKAYVKAQAAINKQLTHINYIKLQEALKKPNTQGLIPGLTIIRRK